MRRRRVVGVVALALVAASACSASSKGVRTTAARDPRAGPQSIVELGDSVASGEGTLYGYTYNSSTMEWTGGNLNVSWPPPYPDCHDSPDAYGQLIATGFGAAFHQFACTGATFASGISAPEVADGTTLRPAEFGNWATMQNLNADYDAARPDLVLVTLGADDVQFVNIIEECIKNGYEHYFHLADLQCTEDNPGPTIKADFTNFLPILKRNYGTLVSWITARAKADNGPVPSIVFTNYPNPFPPSDVNCPDVSWFYNAQIAYLASLVNQMDSLIVSTVKGLKLSNVAVADVSNAYQPNGVDHRWCTSDPWAYGLSIYHMYQPSSFMSQAPFHPTPEGQTSVAEHITPAIVNAFKTVVPARRPPTTTTTTGA